MRKSTPARGSEADELASLIRKGEIDTVLTVFPDHLGRLMGKSVVGRYFLDHVLADGVHACIYLFTVDMEMEPLPGFTLTSWERGYGDMKLVPDMATWRRIPWLQEHRARLLRRLHRGGRAHRGGAALGAAPPGGAGGQGGLRGADRVRARALPLPRVVRRGAGQALPRAHAGVGLYREDYHILQTSKEEGLVQAIRNGMEAAGVPVEFSKGEWGKGQEEINLRYAPALEMADRHALYKHGVKEMAWQQGASVTFMAKYDMGAAGSSCHVHSSLWDRRSGKALFPGRDRQGSALFQQWLAGQMAMARDFALLYAPTVNSYKRYQAGSFAPTRIAAGWDNRTCGFRVCGEGAGFRVENRIPGADANPYLAFAATIAAGLHGIDKRLKGPKPYSGNAYEDAKLAQVPKTFREALDTLEGSRVAREAFGPKVVEHYLRLGRLEQQAFDQVVTDWELLRHFERI